MTAFELAQALLRQYPPDAQVNLLVTEIDHGTGEINRTMKGPVTEILLDEETNTIELVAD